MTGIQPYLSEKQTQTFKLPRVTMRKVLLFIVTFWVVIYSNARMLENVPTYPVVRLFAPLKATRIIELALLFFLFVVALTTKMPKRVFVICICTVVYLVVSLANLVIKGILNFDAVQDIYIRVVPFLLFIILVQGNVASRKELIYFVRFFTGVVVVNLLVFLFYQFPTGSHEDHYAGFFEDAHLLCNVLLVFSAVLFYDFLKTKKKTSLALSFGLLFISLFPSNEKVIALILLIMGLLYLRHILRKQRVIGKIAILFSIFVVLFGAVTYIQKKDGGELWERARVMYEVFGIENVGPVIAWPMAWHEIQESPISFCFGVGAGEYGWIAASRNVMEGKGSVHSKLFSFEFSNENLNNAGYLFRTNTWSSLLAEYGLAGFLIFAWALASLINGVRKFRADDRLERNLKFAFYMIMVIVSYQGFFTPYSNWSVSALMFPAMYLAAYMHRKAIGPNEEVVRETT